MSSLRHDHPITKMAADKVQIAYGHFVAVTCPALTITGNIIAIIGHNGAGKSTLIKSILGLLPPVSGTLNLRGSWNGDQFPLLPQEDMAFCPETGAVFSDISVESYIRMWCRIKRRDADYYKKAGSEILELLELPPLLRKAGRELSKGQRRRVQTAIGFLTSPFLFLFDEPFDGLDVQKTNELAEIILQKSSGMCFIISSHRMDVIERLADMIVVLREGQVESAGSVEKVCLDLCRQTLAVTGVTGPEDALRRLREEIPAALVTRIGETICVTGSDFDIAGVCDTLKRIGQQQARIEPVNPSLVDAMNYHLRKLSESRKK